LSFSDFSNFYYSIANTDSYWSTNNFLLNNSFLNWIVVILAISIINTIWRTSTQKAKYLLSFNYNCFFSLMFYMFFSLVF
jgi:hypothetical protein